MTSEFTLELTSLSLSTAELTDYKQWFDHKVTSVIRNPDHTKDIIDQYPENPSLIDPVMASIEETDEEGAKKLMEGIQWVVWSAGAGGKGGPEPPSVTKFLMVSASSSRRLPASYWTESDVGSFRKTWESIGVYSEAKTVVDEYLYDESRKKSETKLGRYLLDRFQISLGPGKVDLGKAKLGGSVPREDVAAVAVELLEKENGGGALG
ncbi:hypothetical protein F5050DRAFT_1810396 [Lentinula boryana]|uniref:NAD(P)-binding domain-containing protein n=1 Tax=Lentinula boryana TaxID=40481 RepID=A0ABQ8Q499_9AGAR|nr:hypothetical protein F5050DRAFT_1810396 [Lentinula boryana]